MAADLVVHGLRAVERDGEVAALAVGEIVQEARQEQAVGRHRGRQPAFLGHGEGLAERLPGQGLGEGERQVRARAIARHRVGDVGEQV